MDWQKLGGHDDKLKKYSLVGNCTGNIWWVVDWTDSK